MDMRHLSDQWKWKYWGNARDNLQEMSSGYSRKDKGT